MDDVDTSGQPRPRPRASIQRQALETFLIAIVYVALGRLGQLMAISPGNVTAAWPPSGVALVAVLVLGRRAWLGIWTGAVLANTWAFFDTSSAQAVTTSLAVGAAIGVGSVVQPVVGAFLLQFRPGGGDIVRSLSNVIRFVLIVPVMCLISSSIGSLSLCAGGFAPWGEAGELWLTWWLGDGVGVLVFAPLLLAWRLPLRRGWATSEAVAAAATFAGVAVLSIIAFGPFLYAGTENYPLGYLPLPLMFLASARFGYKGATLAVLMVATLAIWGTVTGHGPFHLPSANESLLLLQVFVATTGVAMLVTVTFINERRIAEAELNRQTTILAAINRVFAESFAADTDEAVAMKCLNVAEELTASRFGFIGELNEAGRFDTIALSDPGWANCRMPHSQAAKAISNMVVRGLWGKVITDQQSLISNAPASHPASVGLPDKHPPLTSFMGVPLKRREQTVGMIALANSPAGYTPRDVQNVEDLSAAFLEALDHKRAQVELARHRENLAYLVEQRTGEVRRTARELERSNADLEQFAYLASHDLQEPLRMVAGFVDLLKRRYRDRLDDDACEFIDYASDGARRMQQMIEDLLAFSRVQTTGREFQPVESLEAFDDAVAALGAAIAEQGAEVTRNSLPSVVADRGQLTQVFQNLIGNAIKFHGDSPPRIHASARQVDSAWQFSIRDNGIGIKAKYADRLFGMFQRLHTRQEYPGTGIGLAICKRVVQRHGGEIWFESVVGQGSVFSFTIPDRDPETPHEDDSDQTD